MPTRLFSCTPTRLATFDCPRRYRLTYLDRPAPPRGGPWAHNTIGAAVHVALARWWDLPPDGRTPAGGAELVYRSWQADGFRDDEQSAAWRVRASDWVRAYLGHVTDIPPAADDDDVPASALADITLDPAVPPRGVERTVGTHTGTLAVSGRVDRIDERAGELVVVDYKTGRYIPTAADAKASPALALYALAAGRIWRRRCRRVELHHLPSGRVAAATHTHDSLQRHVLLAEATAHDIVVATDTLATGADADALFPVVTGPGCGWCDMRRHCPEGQRAAPARAPWSALIEPV